MMLPVQTISLLSIFIMLLVPSQQERMEDCEKGKQYWGENSLTHLGACIACPRFRKNCYDQPIQNHKSCLDSCHVKPSSSTKLPLKPTSSFIAPKPSTEVRPSIVRRLVNEEEVQKERTRNGGQNLGWIIGISFAAFAIIALVVALVFVLRRRSATVQADRFNEEGSRLQGIARNEEENNLNEANNNEQRPTEQNRPGERLLEANGTIQQEQNNEDEHLQVIDPGNSLAGQETQVPTPPVQATPSIRNISGVQDSGDDFGSSSLHLTQIEN